MAVSVAGDHVCAEMANNIGGRIWDLDTPAPGVVIYQPAIHIDHVAFVDYNAETDTVLITDRNGRRVWSANGRLDLAPVEDNLKIGWVDGLILSVLDSGRLLVYID